MRPQADSLGLKDPAAPRPEGPREPKSRAEPAPAETLATFQAAVIDRLSTQGVGLRPQPWARVSRPLGPDGARPSPPNPPEPPPSGRLNAQTPPTPATTPGNGFRPLI